MRSGLTKPQLVVLGVFVAWLVFSALSTRSAMALGVSIYLAFSAAIGWSAIRYRSRGWLFGLLLAVLLATLPLWVLGLLRLYETSWK